MKKFLVGILVFTGCTVICSSAVFAAENVKRLESRNANETVWVERTYQKKKEKRLWSTTYQKWLTDWKEAGNVVSHEIMPI